MRTRRAGASYKVRVAFSSPRDPWPAMLGTECALGIITPPTPPREHIVEDTDMYTTTSSDADTPLTPNEMCAPPVPVPMYRPVIDINACVNPPTARGVQTQSAIYYGMVVSAELGLVDYHTREACAHRRLAHAAMQLAAGEQPHPEDPPAYERARRAHARPGYLPVWYMLVMLPTIVFLFASSCVAAILLANLDLTRRPDRAMDALVISLIVAPILLISLCVHLLRSIYHTYHGKSWTGAPV